MSRERSVRMQLSHIAHVRTAYFTHVAGMILYAMAIVHVEFRDRLQTLNKTATSTTVGDKTTMHHLGGDSRRPFDAHLRIHYHL